MKIIKLEWEMEVSDSWEETEEECINLAKEELKSCLEDNSLEFIVINKNNNDF